MCIVVVHGITNAIPCNTMHYHVLPSTTMCIVVLHGITNALPSNTMHYDGEAIKCREETGMALRANSDPLPRKIPAFPNTLLFSPSPGILDGKSLNKNWSV